MAFETENMEFRSQFTDDLYKEVISFANTDGGVIYIGIDNEGNAVGIDNVDETYTRITNGIRDAIMPDVTMFIKYTIQKDRVVRISVGEELSPSMQQVLELVRKQGQATDLDIQQLLGIKKTRAFTLVKQMKEKKLIKAVGRGKDKKYLLY